MPKHDVKLCDLTGTFDDKLCSEVVTCLHNILLKYTNIIELW